MYLTFKACILPFNLYSQPKLTWQKQHSIKTNIFFLYFRWKEECQSITEKFEQKIKDVRSELSHVKKRNDELTSLLRESQEKTLEVYH